LSNLEKMSFSAGDLRPDSGSDYITFPPDLSAKTEGIRNASLSSGNSPESGRDVGENLIPACRLAGDFSHASVRRCEKIDSHGGRAGILKKF
jgi:hypothetical protein